MHPAKNGGITIAYLKIGSALEKIRRKTKNNKEYGRLIKLHAPQASELPSPLRSDCLWFYNIVSVVPENEIADILGVRDLNDLDIGCPTVFRRQFRNKLNKSVPEKRGHYNAIGRGEILEA